MKTPYYQDDSVTPARSDGARLRGAVMSDVEPCGVPAGATRIDPGARVDCAGLGHPGVTYNNWLDRTWCLCGQVSYPGQSSTVAAHLACCGGPLDKFKEKR